MLLPATMLPRGILNIARKIFRLVSAAILTLTFSGIHFLAAEQTAEAKMIFDQGEVHLVASSEKVSVEWYFHDLGTINISSRNLNVASHDEVGVALDSEVAPGETHTYTIEIRKSLSPAEVQELPADIQLDLKANPELYESVQLQSLPLRIPSGNELDVTEIRAEAATMPNATSFRYSTFIRESRLTGPFVDACGYLDPAYFEGDGRGFDGAASSYRTRLNVRVDWLAGGKVSSNFYIGESAVHFGFRLYNPYLGSYTTTWFTERKTASAEKVIFTVAKETPWTSVFVVNHRVGNPLCDPAEYLGADIEYNYTVTIQRSGGYGLVGWAKRAPNHEAYIRDSESPGWQTVFQRENAGFECLLLGETRCEARINYSGDIN